MLGLWILIFLQIVSESFPVSSSGHVQLASKILAQFLPSHALKSLSLLGSESFLFLLHIPTIIIVALFFRSVWAPLLFSIQKRWGLVVRLILYALISDIITAAIYILLKKYPLSIGLCVGFAISSVVLGSLYWCRRNGVRVTAPKMALLGLAQGCALVPGISRFGTVYAVGRWLGFSSKKSFGLAWMIQWPLMVGATGVALLWGDPIDISLSFSLVATLIGATIFAYGALVIAYKAAINDRFWLFGIYLLIPIALCIFIR